MHHTESFVCSWRCRFALNYMSVVSLLTRFCLFRASLMCFAEKMSRNPTSSLSSFLCCTWQLINAVIYHVFTFLQNRSQNYSFFMRFLQLRMFFLSQSVIFLAFTGFYDLFCRKVTHVSVEIWTFFVYRWVRKFALIRLPTLNHYLFEYGNY